MLFSSATKKEVLPGGFLMKMNGYSKYVCCISAPCVMNKYYLNQEYGLMKLTLIVEPLCRVRAPWGPSSISAIAELVFYF